MMKLWNRALWIFTLLLILPILLSGCEKDVSDKEDETSHRHEWSDWTIEKEPTCAENGKKIRTCECGEENVRRLDALGHTYTDGICETCGEPKPSEGLEFRSNGDGTCSVKGMGSCTDAMLVIPKISPEGDRVIGIGTRAFDDQMFLTDVVIPEGVTSIGDHAFYGCRSLVNVRIPTGVTSIGDYAFYECNSLMNAQIPTGVTELGKMAFFNCVLLESISLPEGVTTIGSFAFAQCDALSSVVLPETCTSIGDHAFSYCDGLKEITLPGALTIISENIFESCDFLKTVNVPSSVTGIAERAFWFCDDLTDITYDGTKVQWQAIHKAYGWNEYTGNYTVHCTDGDIPKSEA